MALHDRSQILSLWTVTIDKPRTVSILKRVSRFV